MENMDQTRILNGVRPVCRGQEEETTIRNG
jgi:hypothetical protein